MFVVVVMLYVAVAVDNDNDKYMSTFRFYMPLLVVGVMTHLYAFGPTKGTECSIYDVGVI